MRGWWCGLVFTLYCGVLLAFVAATVVYAIAHFHLIEAAAKSQVDAWYGAVGPLLLMLFFVIALYYAEGSEIAVTTVLEFDEEQLELGSSAATLRSLRQEAAAFISGRQLIVVMLVVLFAGCCNAYVFGTNSNYAPTPWLAWLFTDVARTLYALLFPILTALWLAQLYAKFVAQRRPVSFFRSSISQWFVIGPSIWIGKWLVIGAPSKWLTERTLAAKTNDRSAPGRKKTYEALATFRDGIGIERAHVGLTINVTDGSVDVVMTYDAKAYAPSGRVFFQKDGWDAPILGTPRFTATRQANIEELRFSPDRKSMDLKLRLSQPMEIGESFTYVVSYRVAPGAMRIGQDDDFHYEQRKFPVKCLAASIRLTDTTGYMLDAGRIIADVADDPDANLKEGFRFKDSRVEKDGGYDYEVPYPLFGGTYKFAWKIEQRNPIELMTAPDERSHEIRG